jgi:UDP-N-acetylglucosamine 2-epimerase (non-hydrolysing)
MLKVMTIVGTRPELIKMSRVIAEFDLHTKHILVHTGQNYDYELNQIFFDELEIRKPDHFLNVVGDNVAQSIARVIEKADQVIAYEKPDAVMLYGDTNSCLSVIAAKRNKVPVFHMEAGNRCFDQRVPEELNRKVLDHLSDINLVLTEHARRNLIAEGIKSETIFKTGSHMHEVFDYYMSKIMKSTALDRLNLVRGNFFIVSAHREENVDSSENLQDLIETLNSLAKIYDIPIIVSTHPRTRNRLDLLNGVQFDSRIHFMKPFGFFDYASLQMGALCVISDSGTITEEASLLNFPAITIRNVHERPEGMDAGTLILAGLKKERVLDAVRLTLTHFIKDKYPIRPVQDYQNLYVSKQVLRIVESYTEYVNNFIWKKNTLS